MTSNSYGERVTMSGSYGEDVMTSGSYGEGVMTSGSHGEDVMTSGSFGEGVMTSGSYGGCIMTLCHTHDVRYLWTDFIPSTADAEGNKPSPSNKGLFPKERDF